MPIDKVPSKVFLTLGGGLGDVFWFYLKGKNGWQYLESLKRHYPKTKIKVLSSTHNPQTAELLKYHPYIDEFHEFGWMLDGSPLWQEHKGDYINIKDISKYLKTSKNKIYLTEEDKQQVDIIRNLGSYIVIHPFAGENGRMQLQPDDYIPLIDKLIEKKFNVVVIGGTYTRKDIKHEHFRKEEFNYNRPGLFNLVNQTNVRICLSLIAKQHSFIGCWSAFSCATWINNKPSTIILSPKSIDNFRNKKQGPHGRWRSVTNLNIINSATSTENIINKILSYY